MADVTIFGNTAGSHNERDAASRIRWTSITTGYFAFYNNTDTQIVMFKTTDSGATWAEVDAAGALTHNPRSCAWYWEVQNGNPNDADLMHVVWLDKTDNETQHATFDIGTEAWSAMDVAESWTAVDNTSGASSIGMAVATNGDILVASRANQNGEVNCSLYDLSATSWSSVGGDAGNAPWNGAYQSDQVRVEVGNGGADFIVYTMDESSDRLHVRGYRVAAADWTTVADITSVVDRGLDQQEFAIAYDFTADESLLVFSNDRSVAGNDHKAYTVNWDGTDVAPTLTAEADILTDNTTAGALTVSFDPITNEMAVAYTDDAQLAPNSVYVKTSAAGGTYSWSTASTARNATTADIRSIHGSVFTAAGGGRLGFAFFDDDLNDLMYPQNDTEVAAGVDVAPAAASLTLTGYAPTVAATANQTVAPAAATLTLTGYAPTVVATRYAAAVALAARYAAEVSLATRYEDAVNLDARS